MLLVLEIKSKTDVEIIDEIFIHLIEFSKKHLLEESIKSEISYEQFKVLFQLYGKDKVNMNEIGENICISNSACTVLIDKLIKLDLVERKRSDKDRRIVEVYMTISGKELLNKIIERRHKLIGEILNKMTSDEKELISKALIIFNKGIQNFQEEQDKL